MKKKAMISTVASILLAGTACVGFAACNDTAESIKSAVVSKETWDAAFDEAIFEDFKVELETVETTRTEQFVYAEKTTVTAQIKGGLQYIETVRSDTLDGEVPEAQKEYYPVGEESYEYYVDYTNRVIIAERDGDWVSVTPNQETAKRYVTMQYLLGIFLEDVDFERYEYNDGLKGYAAKDAEEGNAVVYKFKNGKLRAVCATVTDKSDKAEITTVYSVLFTFGGQEVTLPAVSE